MSENADATNESGTEAATAVAGVNEESTGAAKEGTGEAKERIEQTVDVTDVGPCKKHIKVTIPQSVVDKYIQKEIDDLSEKASVPGFRKGKTPRTLLARRFRKDVVDQVKVVLLAKSLEQIGDEQKIEPLTEPDLDITAVDVPLDRDLIYEFDVEVRPDFELPNYKGLPISRPVKEFAAADVERELQRLLKRFGETSTKDSGVERGDQIVASVRFVDGERVTSDFADLTIQVDEELILRDGRIPGFAAALEGAKAGESRTVKAILSDAVEEESMRGKEIDAVFAVKSVEQVKPATLDEDLFARLGVADEGEFRDAIRANLERRLTHVQFESARNQVLEKLLEKVAFDLPPDLLRRQSDRAMQRAAFELRNAGYDDDEVIKRLNVLRQNIIESTATSLRQQFVLGKIAETEKVTVEREDLEQEVQLMAARSGESVRKVRARIEKDGLWEALASNLIERKTIALVIEAAVSIDVPWEEETKRASASDTAMVPARKTPPPPPAEAPESEES